MKNVAVIGAGAMGLAAAYQLLKAGHRVEIFEAEDRPGGQAAHFDFDGLSLERFYHFICTADRPLIDLLQELGIGDRLHWRTTTMGFFYAGRTYDWGNPIALLKFPHLDLISKFRYGMQVFTSTHRSDWSRLDHVTAMEWTKKWCGERAWKVVWEKLFTLKFYEYADDISAAWLWTRIKRVGTSRSSLMQEKLGYLHGGSETLVQALVSKIAALGGRIHCSTPAREVLVEDGAVRGLRVGDLERPFDEIISTVPLVLVPRLIPRLPNPVLQQYQSLKSIGVICVVHKLRRPVTHHFWININDDRVEVPGLIAFSNLRPFGDDHIVYLPYYLPVTHPKFSADDAFFVNETMSFLKLLEPRLLDSDRIATKVARLRHAQPICPPRYLDSVPPIHGVVRGLQIADTSSYYPEDRGISESVRVAAEMATRIT